MNRCYQMQFRFPCPMYRDISNERFNFGFDFVNSQINFMILSSLKSFFLLDRFLIINIFSLHIKNDKDTKQNVFRKYKYSRLIFVVIVYVLLMFCKI